MKMSEKERSPNDYPPKGGGDDLFSKRSVAIDLTTRCNLRCTYCFCYIVRKENELKFDEVIKLLSDLYEMGVGSVAFSGGEPTIRKDFIQIAETMGSWGMSFSLMTNGCLISKEEIEKIVPFLDTTGVSLDGPPEIHNKLRGDYERAVATIENFMEFSIPTTINSAVNLINWDYLDFLVDFALEEGIDGLKVHPILRLDRNRNVEDKYFLPADRYEAFYDWIIEKSLETMGCCYIVTSLKPRKTVLEHPCELSVCWGEHCHSHLLLPPEVIIIQANGDVMPNEVVPEEFKMGNVRENSISEIMGSYFGSPNHDRYLNLHKYSFEKYVQNGNQTIIDWKQYLANESRRNDFEKYEEKKPIQGDRFATSHSRLMDMGIDMKSAKPKRDPHVSVNEADQTVTLSGKEVIKINKITKKVILLCNGKNTAEDIFHILKKDEEVNRNIKKVRIESIIRFLCRMNIVSMEGDKN